MPLQNRHTPRETNIALEIDGWNTSCPFSGALLVLRRVHTKKTTRKTATHPMIGILTNPEPKSPSPTRAKLQAASSLHHQKKATKNFIPVVYIVRVYTHHFWVMWGIYPLWFLGYVGHSTPFVSQEKNPPQTHRSLPASSTVIAWLWPRVTGVGR